MAAGFGVGAAAGVDRGPTRPRGRGGREPGVSPAVSPAVSTDREEPETSPRSGLGGRATTNHDTGRRDTDNRGHDVIDHRGDAGTSAFDGSLRNLAAGACRWAERGLAERCRLLLATHRAVAGRGGGLGPDRVPDQGRRRAIGGGRNGWPVRTPC